jgi:Na+/H+ antiporter NhaD/arsenite permease-like protein
MQPNRILARAPVTQLSLAAGFACIFSAPAWAAGPAGTGGVEYGPVSALPFLGMLLSIAIFPMVAPRFWHRRMGLVALVWTLALLVPLGLIHGLPFALKEAWHAILIEYLPFVTVLLALFTAGGGLQVEGGPMGRPAGNTALLAVGTLLAGVMGTTGVSMVLIHPLLRGNAHRRRKVHMVIFFIVLVANAGGSTSPLGDPPLYVGFLHGVPFEWPMLHLGVPLLVLAIPLLIAFYLVDRYLASSEPPAPPSKPLRVRGRWNLVLIGLVVLAVLVQGVWRPGNAVLLGQEIGIERLAGMAVFLVVTAVSMAITPHSIRNWNMFSWEPMMEVGKLFAAIFITISPVLAMLAAGAKGPLAPLLHLTRDGNGTPSPVAYFWLTGVLSAFLDNAPTYLVFFQQVGGDPVALTGPLRNVLEAIAGGAVFFGALSYIGNAPNMMVRSIASRRGVHMPGFFAYVGWAACLLLPVLLLQTFVFFR